MEPFVAPLINPYLEAFELMITLDPGLQLNLRKKLIWAFSWAIPSEGVIRTLAGLSPIIELGAGTGYWAWLIEQAGGRVVALDQEPKQPPQWHPIVKGNPEDLSKFPDHALFLCWPPLNTSMASNALKYYQGNRVVYLGEVDGRTADQSFHQILSQEWNLVTEMVIPNWPGYRDKLYIYQRS